MFFESKRRLGKVMRLLAFVAALSSACSSKSERFLELVDKSDKPAAAEIIRGKKDFDKVNVALEVINRKTRLYHDFAERWGSDISLRYPTGLAQHYGFFGDILRWRMMFFEENFAGQSYQKQFYRELQTLKQAGLAATAERLRNDLFNIHINLDAIIAGQITKEANTIVATLKNDPMLININMTVSQVVKKYELIKRLQQLLQVARKAGYDKTADAASDALVNIRGAMPR